MHSAFILQQPWEEALWFPRDIKKETQAQRGSVISVRSNS